MFPQLADNGCGWGAAGTPVRYMTDGARPAGHPSMAGLFKRKLRVNYEK